MAKLAHIVAQHDSRKKKAEEDLTAYYKVIQKPALFNGNTKTYEPYTTTGALYKSADS